MNARNPLGRLGYSSPGRRRLADALAGYTASEPEDRQYRALLGIWRRATAKINSLPPQARALRKMAQQKQQSAFVMLKQRFEAL